MIDSCNGKKLMLFLYTPYMTMILVDFLLSDRRGPNFKTEECQVPSAKSAECAPRPLTYVTNFVSALFCNRFTHWLAHQDETNTVSPQHHRPRKVRQQSGASVDVVANGRSPHLLCRLSATSSRFCTNNQNATDLTYHLEPLSLQARINAALMFPDLNHDFRRNFMAWLFSP